MPLPSTMRVGGALRLPTAPSTAVLHPHRHALPLPCLGRSTGQRRRSSVAVRAESSGGGLGGFFKKGEGKEDEARRALQDIFKDKVDPFALDEARLQKQLKKSGGDGGSGGGGRGGGGGGAGGFNFGEWSNRFRRWLKTTLRAVAATLLFVGAICMFYLWTPLIALLTKCVRYVLRLDGSPRAQLSARQVAQPDFTKTEGLGNVEESVIEKWGGEDQGGSDSEEESEEEE